jgi:bifunctional non-homologous end joining protein LigD
MVVGGWVPGRGGGVGSLLVGGHDEDGGLVYCGHVGFGLTTTMRRELRARFDVIRCAASPFHGLGAGLANWVEPLVVVTVDYREFTGRLRHPSLKGIAEVEAASVLLPSR